MRPGQCPPLSPEYDSLRVMKEAGRANRSCASGRRNEMNRRDFVKFTSATTALGVSVAVGPRAFGQKIDTYRPSTSN